MSVPSTRVRRRQGLVVPMIAVSLTMLLIWQFAVAEVAAPGVLTAGAVACYLVLLASFGRRLVGVGRTTTRLEALVETDALTGLPNRRAWTRLLPTLDADADRSDLRLALVVLDLDHFKHVNDQRGHAEGDAVLTTIAATWRQQLPAGALVVRWGGEEFVAALRVEDLDEAVDVAERMRTAMPDGVTSSAGLVLVEPGESLTDAFERADAALYQSKAQGRDRLTVADPDPRVDTPTTRLRIGPVLVAAVTLALTALVAVSGVVVQTVLFVAMLVTAAAGVVAARRRGTSVLMARTSLLVGFGLVILGQVGDAAGLGGAGRAAPADLPFLAGWVTIAFATVGAGRRARGRQVGSALDAGVVAAGLTTTVLLVLSQDMPMPWYSLDGLGYAVWPLLDVALLALFVWLALSPELRDVDARLMPVVLGILLVTDTTVAVLEPLGRYHDGDPLDAGWFLAITVLAIAAWASSRRRWRADASAVLPSWRATALAVGTLAPVAGLAFVDLGDLRPDLGTLIGGSGLLVLLALRLRTLVRLGDEHTRMLASASRRDPLTGLANRRGWEEHAARELGLATRHRRTLTVVMIDLDHFSDVNARLGHVGGDALLRRLATVWTGQLRANDVMARWGGEEFVILMPDCDAEAAVGIVDRMRRASEHDARFSAGVAQSHGEPMDQLVDLADDALYRAKRDGRDRTVVAALAGAD